MPLWQPLSDQERRRQRYLYNNVSRITRGEIRRLARRGGVKRLSEDVYEEIRGDLKVYLELVIWHASEYSSHARRKTITALDVVRAVKRMGHKTLYGYGG